MAAEKEKAKEKIEKDSKIICLGGLSTSSVGEIHNLYGLENCEYSNLPVQLVWHCAEILENFVYCIGGSKISESNFGTREVYRMDLQNRAEWSLIGSMQDERLLHATAVINNKIAVSGGKNGDTSINSVELYEKKAGHGFPCWSKISPMWQTRHGHAMVACDNNLIVLGGNFNQYEIASVEKLDVLNRYYERNNYGKWSDMQPMNTARDRLAAIVCNGQIYAIGGKSPAGIDSSVERFDFSLNTWNYVAKMNYPRWGHSACVYKGRIFVVGGLNEQDQYITQTENYNPETDQWCICTFAQNIIGQKVQFPSAGHALVVV